MNLNLILLFTYDTSLKKWAETGLIEREIKRYQRLGELGVNVTFITYGDKEDFQYKRSLGDIELLPLYAYSKKPKNKIVRLFHSLLVPFIFSELIGRADILKSNQMWGAWVVILSKLIHRKKAIVRCGYENFMFSVHENLRLPLRLFLKYLSFWTYRLADEIVLTSHAAADFVHQYFRINRKKINTIANYVDTDLFKPLGFAKKKKILFIGRLSQQKNIFSLLKAVLRTNYQLDIIGDGHLRLEIENYIQKHRITANILPLVPNKQIPDILNRYAIFILPSYYEGNPKILLEAMACGCAVIGSDVDGIREIITHNQNGLLCGINADSINRAIVTLMEDESLRLRLGTQAREFILENCNLEKILKKEYSLYSLLAGKDA
ncbi:glycosyltransferase family 4 protein [Thermodesulfobacteriota bacterium]